MLPLPAHVTDDKPFADPARGFTITISGDAHGHLAGAAARFIHDAALITGKPVSDAGAIGLHIMVGEAGNAVPLPDDDESYQLRIAPDAISLEAPHWHGALHGLTCLLQRFGRTGLACGTIKDAPRYGWRGLKLDCVRHFISLPTIKRIINTMAFAKMNVLHWGLTNDQAFRLESAALPLLHEIGSGGDYYTKDDVRDLIAHAAARGIRIVPEFNMPAHSTAFLLAYPELAAGTAPTELKTSYGVFDDEFNPALEETYDFIQTFVDEYAGLFPDPYWHFGGDEVTGKHWEADSRVQAFNAAHGYTDKAQTQAHFTRRLLGILHDAGKKPIGWEEVTHGKPDPQSLTIESWISAPDAQACADYECVSATGYYLDHFLTAGDHYRVDPGPRALGGEACAWAEAMQDSSVEIYLWPRAAAIAERLWSKADITDQASLYERLNRWSAMAELLGAQHISQRTAIMQSVCGGKVHDAVRTAATALRPTAYYFLRWDGYSATTPLNRLVQALDPDPAAARQFNDGVMGFLATASGEASLESALNNWIGAARGFARIAKTHGALAQELPLIEALEQIASLGFAALLALTHNSPMPEQTGELLARTKPAFPVQNDIPGILAAIFPVLNDEARPTPLKQMNIAIWPGVNALVQAALDRGPQSVLPN